MGNSVLFTTTACKRIKSLATLYSSYLSCLQINKNINYSWSYHCLRLPKTMKKIIRWLRIIYWTRLNTYFVFYIRNYLHVWQQCSVAVKWLSPLQLSLGNSVASCHWLRPLLLSMQAEWSGCLSCIFPTTVWRSYVLPLSFLTVQLQYVRQGLAPFLLLI